MAFPDFIKALGISLDPEIKEIGISLVIVILSNLGIDKVIKV
jgi:hypothetical protein